MRTISSRTFLCCIPVRVGVVILGIIGLVGGGGIAALGIINLHNHEGSKTSGIIQVTVYALLAVVSVLGLIGAIARKVSLIRLYFSILVAHLIFSMAGGIYAIYRTFHDSPDYINECISESRDPSVIRTCEDGAKLAKGIVITVFILAWFLEIWGCTIVYDYSRQLVDEAEMRNVVKDTEAW